MFWQNFVRLCSERNISPNAAANAVGIKSSGTVTGWKNGSVPRDSVLFALAQYFNVPVEELTKEESANNTEDSKNSDVLPIHIIARNGANLSIEDQEQLLKYAKFMFPEAFKDE